MATTILTGFGVLAGAGGVLALWLSRRGRPWTAALVAIVAMLALTPALVGLPDDVLTVGLLAGTGALAGLLWPCPDQATDPTGRDASRPSEDDVSPSSGPTTGSADGSAGEWGPR